MGTSALAAVGAGVGMGAGAGAVLSATGLGAVGVTSPGVRPTGSLGCCSSRCHHSKVSPWASSAIKAGKEAIPWRWTQWPVKVSTAWASRQFTAPASRVLAASRRARAEGTEGGLARTGWTPSGELAIQ